MSAKSIERKSPVNAPKVDRMVINVRVCPFDSDVCSMVTYNVLSWTDSVDLDSL